MIKIRLVISGDIILGASTKRHLVCWAVSLTVTGEPEVNVVVVSAGAKGLSEFKKLSHEASIIAAKERAEIKMIEFFIPRKLSLTRWAFNRKAPCAVKRAEIVDEIGAADDPCAV